MIVRKLVVWQKAMLVAEKVIHVTAKLPPEERFGMCQQIRRSTISVPSNIAEGWLRESPRDRAYFLSVAHGSHAEMLTQLELCERVHWLCRSDLEEIESLSDEVSRMLSTLRRNFRNRTI